MDSAENLDDLKHALDVLLGSGMAADPIDHARQVGMVASVISQAFDAAGLRCTLVGGCAIEVYAPGIFKSGDIDLVVESLRGGEVRARLHAVFVSLGFERSGRHWKRGELFVEVPSTELEERPEILRIGSFVLNIISKETLLSERLVGFKHWRQTSYGQQAVDMIAAFGTDLRSEVLLPHLVRESCQDAFAVLTEIARSEVPVTEQLLQEVLRKLSERSN